MIEEKKANKDIQPPKLPIGWVLSFSKSQNREYFYNEEKKRSVWSIEDIETAEDELNKRTKLTETVVDVERKKDNTISDIKSISNNDFKVHKVELKPEPKTSGINLAIIVPFRKNDSQKRSWQLNKFISHMTEFIGKLDEVLSYHIFVIEQSDDNRKFNKGKLYNCGFKIALRFAQKKSSVENKFEFDSFIFHSVDLLPNGLEMGHYYSEKPTTVVHIGKCVERTIKNPKYFGGIVAFCRKHFELVDGYPNTFWGWNGSDEELLERVKSARLKISSTPYSLKGSVEDLEGLSMKEKVFKMRKHPEWKCMNKWEVIDELIELKKKEIRPPWWGVSNVFYIEVGMSFMSKYCTKYVVDVGDNVNEDGSIHETLIKYK